MESTFVNGLRPDIRAEVRMMKSSRLARIMEFAQRVEDRNGYFQPNRSGSGTAGFQTHGFSRESGQRGSVLGARYNPATVGSGYSNSGPHPSSAHELGSTAQFSSSASSPQLPSFQRGQTAVPPQTGQRTSSSFKRLTDSELQSKREKGFCFRCDKKYSIGHRCKNK